MLGMNDGTAEAAGRAGGRASAPQWGGSLGMLRELERWDQNPAPMLLPELGQVARMGRAWAACKQIQQTCTEWELQSPSTGRDGCQAS